MATKFLRTLVVPFLASLASAQGDMTVHRMGYWGSNGNAITYYGQSGGIAAYSVASQSCNIGDDILTWTSGGGQTHPVISQNVFRLKGRRFEHLGQSWLKHGFCALCESGCGDGSGSGCTPYLRVGCADTYSSGLNDGSNGGPKYAVSPTSGDHHHSYPNPSGNSTIRGRLQVAVADVTPSQNQGAVYFVEGNYVHYEDHQFGFAHNNSTWRTVNFTNSLSMQGDNNSINHVGESCVYGWKSEDGSVQIAEITNTAEGGSGVHGYYQCASRVWDNGDGTWDYVYVVNNQNSTQGAYEFRIPWGGSGDLTDVWFNDVDYHSGELQDGTDWTMTTDASHIIWSCPQTYAQNPNANAINWCTAYSFGFTAAAGPVADVGELEMFEPGVGSVLTFPLEGPGGGVPPVGLSYCAGDGSGATCPCTSGAAGEGCQNSSGSGAALTGTGVGSVSADTVVLRTAGAPVHVSALFFGGTLSYGTGVGFGNGLICAGGQITRLEIVPTDGAGEMTSTVSISATDGSSAGQTHFYQAWFRDTGDPCGNGHNLSNGLEITWAP